MFRSWVALFDIIYYSSGSEKNPGVHVSMLASYYVLAFLPLLFLDSVFLASESLVGVTVGSSSLDSEAGLLISVTPILMV